MDNDNEMMSTDSRRTAWPAGIQREAFRWQVLGENCSYSSPSKCHMESAKRTSRSPGQGVKPNIISRLSLKRLICNPSLSSSIVFGFSVQESLLQSLILDCDSFQAFTRASPKICSCCPVDVPQTCFQRSSNSGFLCHRRIRASLSNWTWTDVD